MIANNKAQKVEIVNKIETSIDTTNPVPVTLPGSLVQNLGTDNDFLKTTVGNTNAWIFAKPTAGRYNVHVCGLWASDSQTGFITVLPLGADYYNMSAANIAAMEQGFHNLNLLYPATSPAKVVYTKIGNNMEAETIVYSLQ